MGREGDKEGDGEMGRWGENGLLTPKRMLTIISDYPPFLPLKKGG